MLYSTDRRLVGQQFEPDEGLQRAFGGEVSAEISNLSEGENAFERERFTHLVEVYAPVRDASGHILATVEFYQTPEALKAEIASARTQSWALVAAVTPAVYVLLAGIVKRGSDTTLRFLQPAASSRHVLVRTRSRTTIETTKASTP